MEIQSYPDELDWVNATLASRHYGGITLDCLPPVSETFEDKSFLGTFCQACLRADGANYETLRPALYVFMAKYPANPECLRMERHDRGIDQ